MLAVIVLLFAVPLVGCRAGQASAPPPGPVMVAAYPAGWQPVETRLGLKLGLPPNWATRADAPYYLAVWPSPVGAGDADEQLDGVEIERVSSFATLADIDASKSVLDNAVHFMEVEGLVVSPPRSAFLLGAPATVVAGRQGERTALLLVSDAFVVRANILSNAVPHTGETTENVLAFLKQIGYEGGIPPAR